METKCTKKIEIPFRSAVEDRGSISQFRINQDLLKMREEIAEGLPNQVDQSVSLMDKSLVMIKKKRSKKTIKKDITENTFLNISKLGLRKVIQQQKVKLITRNFISKIKRNVSSSLPIQFYPYANNYSDSFFSKNGREIPYWFDLSFAFLSIIQIMALCFVYTLSLVFDSFIDNSLIETLQTFSMCFYTIEIIINFLSIKTINGRKISTLKQIFIDYIKRKFFVDILCLVILIVDINTKFIITKYIRLCVVLKIRECLYKMQKIENVFINNFYKEQYWSLTKVFLINFIFAHFLAVVLLAMANFEQSSNWILKINQQNAPWYELYSWAYYWGTTIMLTVGFGDLSASNYKEALCLTVVQTFSCVLLAYNINCVGNLINNIRTQDQQKIKNFRIMRKLAEKNQVNEDLEWKICNFISESDKMKKQFGYEDEKQFISNLPTELKAEYLKQSNIKIFQSISFFRLFTEKTLLSLAENIQMRVAHPQQIVFKTQQNPRLLILKQGKLGYCTKLSGSDHNGTIVSMLKIKTKQKPELVYLNFLTQNTRNVKFKIISINYSRIFDIRVEDLLEIIKNNTCDFENYCFLKDKSKHVVDQFEIIKCPNCPTNHTRMSCPRVHYIPISQMIVYRYLQNVKISKNGRAKFLRKRNRSQIASGNPFKLMPYFSKLEQSLYKNKRTNKNIKQSQTKKQDVLTIDSKKCKKLSKINFYEEKNGESYDKEIIIEHLLEIISTNKRYEEFEQFKWDIECDLSHNYKVYFADCNASELSSKVTLKKSVRSNSRSSRSSSQCFPLLTNILGAKNQFFSK